MWDQNEAIKFHPHRERWIRIETDAQSTYHDQLDLSKSKFNFVADASLIVQGTTKLANGRFMVKLKAKSDAKVGDVSKFSVELVRPGLGALTDSRKVEIVSPPPARQGKQTLSMPKFEFVRIESKDDPNWTNLGWPEDISKTASYSEYKEGVLTVYYSVLFPEFDNARKAFEQKPTLQDPVAERDCTKLSLETA